MALHTIIIKYPGGTREKIVGATLTENNYTDAEKDKLANVGELTPEQLAAIVEDVLAEIDLSVKVDKVTGSSLVPDTEISKIHASGSDNQDLSNLQPKESGKGLSTNDYTEAEETKLSGIESGATVGANWNTNITNKPSILDFSGLAKITVGTSQPSNPSVGDLWIDAN